MGLINGFDPAQARSRRPEKLLPERPSTVTAYPQRRDIVDKFVELIVSTASGISDKEASSIAKACVRKVAVSAGSVPLVLHSVAGGEYELVDTDDNPIVRLIESPNASQSRAEFVMEVMQQIQRWGRCIVVCLRSDAGERDLVVADYRTVSVNVDPYDGVTYTIALPEPIGEQTYASHDVIDWILPDVGGSGAPEGPWQIAQEELEGDGNARRWQHISMTKRLLPDGIFQLPDGTSEATTENFKKQVEDRSGVEYANQSLVDMGEVKFTNLSNPPAEADFIETRKFYRDQICSVFGVPPPVLGFMENATLANLDASKVMMWEDTVIPYLNMLCGALSTFLNAQFDGMWRVTPDVSGIAALRQRVLESANAAKVLHDMGIPADIVNDRLGLGIASYDGSDEGIVDANKIPFRDVVGAYNLKDRDGYQD